MNLNEFKIEAKKLGWILCSNEASLAGYKYTFRKLHCKQSVDVYCMVHGDKPPITYIAARTNRGEVCVSILDSAEEATKTINKICSDSYMTFSEFYDNECLI